MMPEEDSLQHVLDHLLLSMMADWAMMMLDELRILKLCFVKNCKIVLNFKRSQKKSVAFCLLRDVPSATLANAAFGEDALVEEAALAFADDDVAEDDDEAFAALDDDDEELLDFDGGRFPLPQIEKSKSSALKSRLCLSKYCRNSLRDRNFLPSGLWLQNDIILRIRSGIGKSLKCYT